MNSMNNIFEISTDGKTLLRVHNENITHIVIPNGITTIDTFAFNSTIQRIDLPNSVRVIPDTAFEGCPSLTDINVAEDNLLYRSIDGVLFSKDMTKLIQYPRGRKITKYKIPLGVTTIGDSAFEGCHSLQNIDLPNSLTVIKEYAFNQCSSLLSIDLPNNIRDIEHYAFEDCSSLKSISIPNGIKTIGSWAFSHCSSLHRIDIPKSVTRLGNGVVHGCSNLKELHMHWTDIGYTEGNWALADIIMMEFDCTLYVPFGTLSRYKRNRIFGQFKNIKERNI